MSAPDVVIPGIVGTILSLVVTFVNQSHWSGRVKGIVVIASSIVAGLATAIIRGDLGNGGWIQSVATVWGAAVLAWQLFWKPTGIGPQLEEMTNLK